MSDALPVRRSPQLAPQFDAAEQQRFAGTLGMWAFLATELLFFGGMFLGYAVYRAWYFEAWAEASREENLVLGTLNTGILLTSSLTVAWALHAVRANRREMAMMCLIATVVLGTAFLGIKGWEYLETWRRHHVPGPHFVWHGAGPAGPAELFFSFYFAMTGCHALHMLFGLAVLLVLLRQLQRGVYSADYHTPVELTGLYWHFVDCVWVFLFPMFYLIDRS